MFFERRCVVCGDQDGPVCRACGESFVRTPTGRSTSVVRSVFELNDDLRPVLVALKYRRERRLANWAAEQVAALVPQAADALCWVPATPERVRWRGYDQATEIAMSVGRQLDMPVRGLLRRGRHDQRQTGQSRHDRSDGPDLSLSERPPGLVVVIDDVVTTGSTLATAEQVLRAGGAERVVPVVLAAAPRHTQLRRSTR